MVTVGLSVVAFNEFRGRDRLRAYDPSAATLLGWNQLGLLAGIIAYCVWMMTTSKIDTGSTLSAQLGSSRDSQALIGDLSGIGGAVEYAVVAFYGLVIALSVIFQGLNAWYYFSRRPHIEAYVRDTPAWVRDVQRTTARGWLNQ